MNPHKPIVHAWKKWAPKTDDQTFYEWHHTTCAMCGQGPNHDLVLDHCHRTGLARGFLCRACNIRESTGYYLPHWKAWVEWDNPARACNHVEVYVSAWGGNTPLNNTTPLRYFTADEKEQWWARQQELAKSGKDWPSEIVPAEVEQRLRDYEMQQMRDAVAKLSIFDSSYFGGSE